MTPSVTVSTGLPETVLSDPDAGLAADIEQAQAAADGEGLRRLVASHPRNLERVGRRSAIWPATPLESYAYYRVGYHRGLDALRQAGWRGSGYVRWSHPSNRGFLRCLQGLGRQAAAIREDDEATRCRDFLRQLDPHGEPGQPLP